MEIPQMAESAERSAAARVVRNLGFVDVRLRIFPP